MQAQKHWYLDNIDLRDQVVVDVGANVGELSQLFFDRGSKNTRVVSVEPLPANIKAIETRIRKSRARKRWTVKKCAISNRDGHVQMRQVTRSEADNAVVTEGELAEDAKRVVVACRRLEGLVPDATVVKLDVEGHEYAFLPSALEALPGVHTWALELHAVDGHPLEDTLALFAERGFSLIAAGQKRDDPEGGWLNVEIPPSFGWDRIPGTPSIHDGVPGVFKMIHVIARKEPTT